MVKKLIPGLFTLFNFFESYRSSLLQHVAEEGKGRSSVTADLMPGIEESLMESYDGPVLLEAHQIYQIFYSTFTRSLRPPSYAGTLERSLRGWSRSAASHRDMVKLLIFGGLREVKNVIRHHNYNGRLAALEKFKLSLGLGKKDHPYPRCSTISALRCTVMAPLDNKTASYAAPRLPKISDIWLDRAPQVMTRREIIGNLSEVPDIYEFMAEMMESDDEDSDSHVDEDSSTVEEISSTIIEAENETTGGEDEDNVANHMSSPHAAPGGFATLFNVPPMHAVASSSHA
jgi:hypothetical protein